MVVFNAERFGLSTLHQLRGRIGRNEYDSTCILIGSKSNKRLQVLEESTDGFYITEKDYEMRKEGDLFGIKQSDPNGYGQGSYYFYRLGGTFFITYPTNLKLVNKHRKALGVSETFEDLVKKITWEYSHNIVKWHSIVNMGYGNEEADKENAIQLKKEIDAEHAAGDFHRMYFEKELKVSE